jgi:eukaryotic-like serine/threonine-protein kinase
VQNAGPGTLLGGRYSLRRRLRQGPDLESWSAHDTTLEREVSLTIVYSEHPHRAGVVDAARRAAGVEDTRLVRILDVGTQDDSSFIVQEALIGSESLAAILLQGPLPPEEARRIAGETARGLEAAGQRGLHHLRLTPHHLMVAPDGAIRISGVAVAEAVDGPGDQEPDPAAASRRDAVCVVAVAYAALTGRWPLDEQIADVEPAPRVVGGVAAPSEIMAGVPADLDSICRTTLNEGAGPLTPGDLADQIAPWSRDRIHRGGVEPTIALQLPSWDVAQNASGSSQGTEETVAIHARDVSAQNPSNGSADTAGQGEDLAEVAGPTAGDRAAAAGASATKAVGAALASAGEKAGAVRDKMSSFGGTTDGGAPADAGLDHGDTRTEQMTLPGALVGQFDDEPPLPMLPASTAQAPSRGQSKIVVAIVATFVGLAALVGYCGLGDLGRGVDASAPSPTTTPSVSKAPVTVPSATPQSGPTPAKPIAILSATGFDPEGDRSEKSGQAARVYDDDPSTSWTSEGYNSADFGGLKDGVGVLLDLGQPTSVHQVTLDLAGDPVDVTVYSATDPSLEGATVIGTAKDASGRTQLKATSTLPEGQYVIVWFTRLAPDGGQFRAAISEIALS